MYIHTEHHSSYFSVLLQMANMLEGGGKTPILPPEELQGMGFKLVAYPLSLLGVSIRAMERALTGLKAGVVPDVRDTGTFVDIQMAVGFPVSYLL
jgi:2-methylisocitrate lyase-like PEP mutase family enzyme